MELLIYRHAKAEAQSASSKDCDRELSTRGREQATKMGIVISERQLVPDIVLASDSVRTRQTVELAAAGWDHEVKVIYLSELYDGGPEEYICAIAHHANDACRIMVVGHNPTVEEIVHHASGKATAVGAGCLAVIETTTSSLSQLSVDSPMTLRELLS